MPSLSGNIIRILDTRTVIINLGRNQGITHNSTFRVHASPEPIIDPSTSEELGKVVLVKARLKASQVFDKFTIATTKWLAPAVPNMVTGASAFLDLFGSQEVHTGELRVIPEELQPWKAVSEEPVRIGDIVEVESLPVPPPPKLQPAPPKSSSSQRRPKKP